MPSGFRARAVRRVGRELGLTYLGRRPVDDVPYELLRSEPVAAREVEHVIAGSYRGTPMALFDVGDRTGGMLGSLRVATPGPELVVAGYASAHASVAIVAGGDARDALVSSAQWRWLARHATFELGALRRDGILVVGPRQHARELITLATWLHTFHTISTQ